MRESNRRWRGAAVVPLLAALLAGGCAAAATVPPTITPAPTPVITPDPHLSAPASVDDVFRLLGSAGVRITPNTASGGAGEEPLKRINGTYASWPIVLVQYSTPAALDKAAAFDPKRPPGLGESPYIIAGMNILIEFGPQPSRHLAPPTPDGARREAFVALVAALDPLLGPLRQRSVEPVPLPTPTPAATVAASASAPQPRPSVSVSP